MKPLSEPTVVFRGTSWSVVTQKIELPNGHRKTTETVRHPGAVVIVPRTEDGSIVFTRQYRFSLNKTIIELPAGTRNSDEDPLLCAKRELQEEVGLAATSWTTLGILYPAPGFCDEIQYCYLAEHLQESSLDKDADEIIEPIRLSPDAIASSIKRGELCDAKTLACLFYLNL